MYCPMCAAHNPEDLKFCRSCGEDLEIVALALSGKLGPLPDQTADELTPVPAWQKGYSNGIRDLAVGIVLTTGALLLSLVPMHYTGPSLSRLMIWSIFLAWMAVTGIVELANGISGLAECKRLKPGPDSGPGKLASAGKILLLDRKGRATSRELGDPALIAPSGPIE